MNPIAVNKKRASTSVSVSEGGKRMLATTLRAMMAHNERNIAENAKTKDPKKHTAAEKEALTRIKNMADSRARSSSF
jgi:hypothetical protein